MTVDEEFKLAEKTLGDRIAEIGISLFLLGSGVVTGCGSYYGFKNDSSTNGWSLGVIAAVLVGGGALAIQKSFSSKFIDINYLLLKSELESIEKAKKDDTSPQPEYIMYQYAQLFGNEPEKTRDRDKVIVSPTAPDKKVYAPALALKMINYCLIDLYVKGRIRLHKVSEPPGGLFVKRKGEFPDTPLDNIMEGFILKQEKRAKLGMGQYDGTVMVSDLIGAVIGSATSNLTANEFVRYIATKGSRASEKDVSGLIERIGKFKQQNPDLYSFLSREVERHDVYLN